MSHIHPVPIILGAVTVTVPNFFVQAALAAGDGVAAWGVFATTLCGGIGFLIKTWWDGKNRAEKVLEAMSKAQILQHQVNLLEARHKADMDWVQSVTDKLTDRVDRNKSRVENLAGAVQVVTGSSDAILPMDATSEVDTPPRPE